MADDGPVVSTRMRERKNRRAKEEDKEVEKEDGQVRSRTWGERERGKHVETVIAFSECSRYSAT